MLLRTLLVALCSLVLTAGRAFALPGDPDDPAAGPHEIETAGRSIGHYWFDPDGPGGVDPFQGWYADSEGGGWLMVLNYVHKGGTNPSLTPRSTDLPLQDGGELGVDQQGTPQWGHATPELLSKFNVTELRFFAISSGHSRKIHFATTHRGSIEYATSGIGSMEGLLDTEITFLGGHTAGLPLSAKRFSADMGDAALTQKPFWISGSRTWGIRGDGKEWEVDDAAESFQHDTIHRVFIRTDFPCGDGFVEGDERCDDGNTETGDGCSSTCRIETSYNCDSSEPSVCWETGCGNGHLDRGNVCDDSNTESGDGCSSNCRVEHGFACDGEPSVCASRCGDGLIARGEECDDGNLMAGDGCAATCTVEGDWVCAGEPSLCDPDDGTARCGQDLRQCDGPGDGSAGCSASGSAHSFPQAALLLIGGLWLVCRRSRV